MNWKARQRHLAQMRWKKRGHKEIMVPPAPIPVKVHKVFNKQNFCDAILANFVPKVGLGPRVPMIQVIDRWGTTDQVPKKSPFECPFNFIDKLEKKGFKVLGRGAYSTVLAKDGSDRAIKVSRSLDDWIDYIQWGAKNGYTGNFVPRVYSWKRHTRSDDRDWSVAVVEKMANTCHDPKHDMALLLNLYYPANSGSTMAQLYMEDLCPGSYKFFEGLSKNGFNTDVSGKNAMVRKDGSFCVTDPTCGSIKTTQKRFRSGELSPSALLILGKIIESSYRHRSQRIKEPYKGLVNRL